MESQEDSDESIMSKGVETDVFDFFLHCGEQDLNDASKSLLQAFALQKREFSKKFLSFGCQEKVGKIFLENDNELVLKDLLTTLTIVVNNVGSAGVMEVARSVTQGLVRVCLLQEALLSTSLNLFAELLAEPMDILIKGACEVVQKLPNSKLLSNEDFLFAVIFLMEVEDVMDERAKTDVIECLLKLCADEAGLFVVGEKALVPLLEIIEATGCLRDPSFCFTNVCSL